MSLCRHHGCLAINMSSIPHLGREGVLVYECSSHPSNIKTWPPLGVLPIHLKWPQVHQFGVFKASSSVELTKNNNIHDAYYFTAFMLDEWEIHLYTISLLHLWIKIDEPYLHVADYITTELFLIQWFVSSTNTWNCVPKFDVKNSALASTSCNVQPHVQWDQTLGGCTI